MFKHILIPTDGSEASERAIRHGLALASEHRSRVTGLYVIADKHVASGWSESLAAPGDAEAIAARFLSVVAREAEAAGVPCECYSVHGEVPAEEIVAAAEQRGCDLIHMASHGRVGIAELLIGSVTSRVLHDSKVPVLVYR